MLQYTKHEGEVGNLPLTKKLNVFTPQERHLEPVKRIQPADA